MQQIEVQNPRRSLNVDIAYKNKAKLLAAQEAITIKEFVERLIDDYACRQTHQRQRTEPQINTCPE